MPIRTLFSREELGVTHFEQLRKKTINYYKSAEEIAEHKNQLIKDFEIVRLDAKRDILKTYIPLIDGKADELNTLKTMLVEYYKIYNNSVHYVKDFVFGTQVMRLLYLLNLSDEAIKVIEFSDFLHEHFFTKILIPLI